MVQPTPPTDGFPAYVPAPEHADGGWTASPPPSWAPAWPPPGQQPVPLAAPVRERAARGPLVLAGVALAGVLAGAVGSAFLVTAVFVGSAEDIGREIGAGLGPEIGRATGEGFTRAMEDAAGSMLEEGILGEEFGGWGAGPGYGGTVEQFPAVEPGDLGPDPVLNQYAADCFAGNLQACDDLLYESAPLSKYEQYAFTCGGRVKQYEAPACIDLE